MICNTIKSLVNRNLYITEIFKTRSQLNIKYKFIQFAISFIRPTCFDKSTWKKGKIVRKTHKFSLQHNTTQKKCSNCNTKTFIFCRKCSKTNLPSPWIYCPKINALFCELTNSEYIMHNHFACKLQYNLK